MKQRGQMQLSFGMIFSILLIIFFLAFAFFGIKSFLGVQDAAKTGKFITDFKSDVDRVWRSAETSQSYEYSLPSSIEEVCFADFSSDKRGQNAGIYDELKTSFFENENMFFYPVVHSETDAAVINNIDISKITLNENPFCIKTVSGKVKIRLTKDISDALVTIGR